MKDCVRYAPMLGAREGDLSPEEQRALDAHLQACPACRALAADLAALDGLVGESLMARANARDFAPFVDGVMARVGVQGSAPARRHGFLGWFRAHPRAALASLVPVLAAVALVVYVRIEGDDGQIALFEMATEGEVTMVLQTSDGPVVLLGEEHS
ncbi:zf-HC2 domain-containing protein [Anaeromyxobacter sp. Fw109-5]|uniref:zf-HC2 domain-containing protein n=1 Tax=Anaeromyxobacter sp. (strain Fw109-5) TaxID=404589 RepID=UPI0000ED6DA5|nr:zf-HC2 domain-containing protein [Anaeromyxobacter sp. Fw109-5]ABS28604.1 putative transmembrane anti-sigma factor [Anaeromyxobacter sp. Fw109-5]